MNALSQTNTNVCRGSFEADANVEYDCFMTESFPDLSHLPVRKQRELAHVLKIIFDEFDAAQQSKQSGNKRLGRILKVLLFGSYARGDWVEDHKSGYRSDYDILVIVNAHNVAEDNELWFHLSDHLLREITITKTIETPVNVIVHTLHHVNDELARGRPFFIDVIGDGKILYEREGHPFTISKSLNYDEIQTEASNYFKHWSKSIEAFRASADFLLSRGDLAESAFTYHQTAERLYHCVLLTLTLYSPKSHRLKSLRSSAERIEPRLIDAWPRDTKFARRSFERLDRAYVDARYSPHYEITNEELAWIVERIDILQSLVRAVCEEYLDKTDPK